MDKKSVQTIWFQGHEFRRVIWRDRPDDPGRVILVFHIAERMSPGWFKGSLVSRREI